MEKQLTMKRSSEMENSIERITKVWVTDVDDIKEIGEVDANLIQYNALTWEEAKVLVGLSLEQGLTCIITSDV